MPIFVLHLNYIKITHQNTNSMNDEEIRIRVQLIREELERMQPDIDQLVQAQFGQDIQNLQNNHQGVLGYIQAVEIHGQAPNVPEEAQEEIVAQFNQNMDNLRNGADAFRQRLVNERIDFLIARYVEDGNEEDRRRVAGILNEPEPQAAPDAGAEQGDGFDPDSFDYSESVNEDYGSLTEEFNDNSLPPPQPPQGMEP